MFGVLRPPQEVVDYFIGPSLYQEGVGPDQDGQFKNFET